MLTFDAQAFLNHLCQQFEPMENHFTYDMAANIVAMAVGAYPKDTAGMRDFLTNLIPELRPDEVDRFWKTEN